MSELRAVYHEKLTPTVSTGISSTYLSLPGAHPAREKPMKARVTVETASIYYLLTGGTPQSDPAGVGHLLDAGDGMMIEGYRDIANFRCIESAAGNGAVVKITLYYL